MTRPFVALVVVAVAAVADAQPPPSPTLERAIKLYDKRDFFSASVELQKVIDGETGDLADGKERARFFLGKTLYQLGLRAMALAELAHVVEGGTTYRTLVAKWLAAIGGPMAEPLLRAYSPTNELDSATQDAVRFASGHYDEVSEA